MSAAKYSFIIEQGATTNIEVNWKDNDSPIDLSDYHARMQIRPSVESEIILLSLSSSLQEDGTGINLSGSNFQTPLQSGSLSIYISAKNTENLNFGEAFYDLELVKNDVVTRLLEGKVKLSKNVTR